MIQDEVLGATLECHLVLARPDERALWVEQRPSGLQLPSVVVSLEHRLAPQIQRAVLSMWRVPVALVAFVQEDVAAAVVLVDILGVLDPTGLVHTTIDSLSAEALPGTKRKRVLHWLDPTQTPAGPFGTRGWYRRIASWIEDATGVTFDNEASILQLSLASDRALARFTLVGGRMIWLKADSVADKREFCVTRLLSSVVPEFGPRMIACREDWRAWLSEDEGRPLRTSDLGEFEQAAVALAQFQQRTIGHIDQLIEAGACDRRAATLAGQVLPVLEYLEAAMSRQTSSRADPISPSRLEQIGRLLHEACLRLGDLQIPDSLLHNDLNAGNLLIRDDHCVFIDWREAAVGNPCVTFEHLLRLVPSAHLNRSQGLRALYRRQWESLLASSDLERAFALAPAIGIFAHLLGRGDWLGLPETENQVDEGYRRSLARHLDRAARRPEFLEALNS